MSKPPFERIEELFNRATALAPQERAAFLDDQCAGDGKLRAAVAELLVQDAGIEQTADVLVSPIVRTEIDPSIPPQTAPPVSPPDAIAGYELLGELGRGGMGIVYKARQTDLNRVVAIKMLLSSSPAAAEQLARFRTEAEALARLQHPNIVQIYEIGEHNGRPYFAMEYVPGPSLGHMLNGVPQPAPAAASFVETLARAVHAVHQCGIIHRDLKPANILLQPDRELMRQGDKETGRQPDKETKRQDELPGGTTLPSDLPVSSRPCLAVPLSDCRLKITDFGLAKDRTSDRALTRTGLAMGTPCYMAPEQAYGDAEKIGPPTDVYALGVILYEMVTGRPPFQGATPLETLQRVISEEALPPRRLRPHLPRDLETICLKCVEKEPPRRYATAWDLAEDLRRFQGGEPVRARPISTIGRMWRWCRRRPVVAALLALSTLLALALLVTAFAYNARLAQALAQREQQVIELDVTLGMEELNEGNSLTALLWLTEALRQEKDFQRQRLHRTRIGTALRQCPQLAQLLVFDQPVHCFPLAPSVGRIVTTGPDGAVRIFDVFHNTPVGTEIKHPGAVRHAGLSPDGRFLCTACVDGIVRVWDVGSGKAISSLTPGAPVSEVKFNPEGRVVIVRRSDAMVQLWDRSSGTRIPLPGLPDEPLQYSACSDDGRWVLTVDATRTARVWNAATLAGAAPPLALRHRTTDAAFSADGRLLALASIDNAVRIWELKTGSLLYGPFRHLNTVNRMAFSPKGDRIFSFDDSGASQLWRLGPNPLLLRGLAHSGSITQARFSADSRLLVAGGGNNRARVWDATTGDAVTPPLWHNGSIVDAAFISDGTQLITVGKDGIVRLWSLAPSLAPAPSPHRGAGQGRQAPATQAAFELLKSEPAAPTNRTADDGRQLVKLPDGDSVQVLDAASGAPLGPAMRHTSRVTHFTFSPNGRRILTTSDDNTAQLWDAKTGERLTAPLQHKGTVFYASFNGDGSQIITASEDHTARIWDAASGSPLSPPLQHPRTVERAYFAPDGNHAITICADRSVRSWDITPDKRPVEDLVRLAQLLTGGRIDLEYGVLPLTPDALRSTWQALRSAPNPQ
jgi:WD40 repeat protein/serine/threonine protein kinase